MAGRGASLLQRTAVERLWRSPLALGSCTEPVRAAFRSDAPRPA